VVTAEMLIHSDRLELWSLWSLPKSLISGVLYVFCLLKLAKMPTEDAKGL